MLTKIEDGLWINLAFVVRAEPWDNGQTTRLVVNDGQVEAFMVIVNIADVDAVATWINEMEASDEMGASDE